ncbi:cell division protein CrgA [Oerskovia sp. NPDC056781]|uniref:Cell division protein CrgA n=1 Tax=Oerskovia rustica TaxID=2762237 RepID=A0ABR8RNM6_9CELL|nr:MULTISPECIES: cell division protein CrgA [Oerskovia]MBD7949398.1 cell division protein CrgA [Oerskovia rustica]QDW61762.1 cell division protein CrgA [Oerskovia sp. KBS0722]
MPESKSRKKPVKVKAPQVKKPDTGNPRWLVPTMLTLMLLGLAWIVIFYLTSNGLGLPIPAINQWNLAIGFALIIAGFVLTTRWK